MRREHTTPGQQGAAKFWYEDDQIAAVSSSIGASFSRQERVDLLTDALGSWRPTSNSDAGRVALDAGSGDGVNIPLLEAFLNSRSSANTVVALDYSSARTSKAARFPIPVVAGDVTRIPFQNLSLDVILLSHVLEHVHEPRQVLTELARAVKPDGIVVIAVPNEGCLLAWVRNHVLQRSILKSTDHVSFFTLKSLIRLIDDTGHFDIAYAGSEGFFLPHMRLTAVLRNRVLGRRLLSLLRTLLPSQSAGLAVALVRKSSLGNYRADDSKKQGSYAE